MHQRKKRLRLSAVIAAGTLAAAGLATLPFTALADTTDPADTTRQQDFATAATQYHIPLNVLLGLAYQESGWQSHGELPSTDGGFG
ncbi:N-acetylmuramoyl-L-alanine amidase, partial [Streptomyces sp. NPDC088358]